MDISNHTDNRTSMTDINDRPDGVNKSKKDIAYYFNKISQLQRNALPESESVKRYALYPVVDEEAFRFYQQQENFHWFASELDYINDRIHYDECTPEEKGLIDLILAFFLYGDGGVSATLLRYLLECKTYEEQLMFISQLHIESVHAETYGLAALTFKRNDYELFKLLESVGESAVVKAKIGFNDKWMGADAPRYHRLTASACFEGIFFCTLFAAVFWFRSRGKFQNFITANQLISRDESLHRDYNIFLAKREIHESGKTMADVEKELKQIVLEAVAIEDAFVDALLPNPIRDLNAEDLKIYVRVVAQSLWRQFGLGTLFTEKSPFTWMDEISLEQKGNFYEVGIAAYQKRSLDELLNWKKRAGLVEDTVSGLTNPEDVDF